MRGGGNQAFHIGSTFAVMAALTAVLARDVTGRGQHVDVSMHAAANVTTESGQLRAGWSPGRRCSARPAGTRCPTISDADADALRRRPLRHHRLPAPLRQRDFESLLDWLDDARAARRVPRDRAARPRRRTRWRHRSPRWPPTPLAVEIFGAGREALMFIAERITADEFFLGGQTRGLACGVVAAPEEAFDSEHFVARGFPVEVEHEDLGRTYRYPGAPFLMPASPWRIARRAPHVGEHDAEILGG